MSDTVIETNKTIDIISVVNPIVNLVETNTSQGPRITEAAQQGLPGAGSATNFIYTPPSANVTWVITHNLNRYPSVTVTDSTGRLVIADITYLNANILQIDFYFATSGTAYLN